MQVTDASRTLFHIRLLATHGIPKLAVAFSSFLLHGRDESVASLASLSFDCRRQRIEKRLVACQQSRGDQRSSQMQVGMRCRHAFLYRLETVSDCESRIPKQPQDALD